MAALTGDGDPLLLWQNFKINAGSLEKIAAF